METYLNNCEYLESDDNLLFVSKDDINDMNIIINDCDCSDVFFNAICNKLKDDGFIIRISKNNQEINVDNSVIITLDQQYNSGINTMIFAPYDNARIGNSDSLVLAMQSSFKQNGFLVNELSAGKLGFREDSNGNVSTLIPTETESALNDNCYANFVTISLGTQNSDYESVAKSIEMGLARQRYYIDNYDSNTDLIYRADSNEKLNVIANYFDSSLHELSSYNNLTGDNIPHSMIIVNPNVKNINIFNENTKLEIKDVKTNYI